MWRLITNLKSVCRFLLNKKNATIFAICFIILSTWGYSFLNATAEAGTTRNFYVATEPNLVGSGYDVFSTQTLVVQQNDQVNLTVRNLDADTLHLQIEGQPTVTILPTTTGATPSDISVPVFTASAAGIFSLKTQEHPEMNGQLIVLPSDFSSYNPSAQTRSFTELVLPDFAGDGYDKFFPGTMVVNQGDTVNVSVINTDDMPHGFAIAAYEINVAVNPGQDLSNGTIAPVTTGVPTFVASKPGIFRFLCTTPCGPGHFEMVGVLVVLPTKGTAYNPVPQTTYSYLTIKPDFAGDGYDKYIPSNIFVDQNDLVYIKIRNTDDINHGFALPNFGINNETVGPATNTTPTDTYVTAFFASQSGIYEFFCTIYCGPGHNQMIGNLVVLPSRKGTNAQQNIPATTLFVLVLISLALLIVGILIGAIAVARFDEEKSKS